MNIVLKRNSKTRDVISLFYSNSVHTFVFAFRIVEKRLSDIFQIRESSSHPNEASANTRRVVKKEKKINK